ncbi:MAG: hypothetical protein J6W37_07255 [Bacteroidales bacterium]|nr:hypothetical protein [Bacteroidales bacterium]
MFKKFTIFSLFVLLCGFASAIGEVDNPNFRKTKTFTISYKGDISDVSKVFSSISTLKGIQYYSNSHERWETLYKEAGFINNTKEKRFVADDKIIVRPTTDYYCLLQDNSLGDCVFKINYAESGNMVTANFILVEPLTFWGITGVQANDLRIQLKATKVQDTIQAVITIEARYREISFIEDMIPKSLDARLDALYRWITKSLTK